MLFKWLLCVLGAIKINGLWASAPQSLGKRHPGGQVEVLREALYGRCPSSSGKMGPPLPQMAQVRGPVPALGATTSLWWTIVAVRSQSCGGPFNELMLLMLMLVKFLQDQFKMLVVQSIQENLSKMLSPALLSYGSAALEY